MLLQCTEKMASLAVFWDIRTNCHKIAQSSFIYLLIIQGLIHQIILESDKFEESILQSDDF